MRPTTAPEFSRPVRIDNLPASGQAIVARATARECDALARRFGLARLKSLEVAGEVMAIRGGTVIRLDARLSAEVTQTCVVTLAPLNRRIDADFVRLYSAGPADGVAGGGEEIFFDEEGEDIEPIADHRIDVGEAAAEQLALELDPYPRAPGSSLAPEAGSVGAGDNDEVRSQPFAGLAERTSGAGRKQSK